MILPGDVNLVSERQRVGLYDIALRTQKLSVQ